MKGKVFFLKQKKLDCIILEFETESDGKLEKKPLQGKLKSLPLSKLVMFHLVFTAAIAFMIKKKNKTRKLYL